MPRCKHCESNTISDESAEEYCREFYDANFERIQDKYKKVSELFKSITFLRAELLKLGYDFNTLTVSKQITKTEDLPDKLGGLYIGIIDTLGSKN